MALFSLGFSSLGVRPGCAKSGDGSSSLPPEPAAPATPADVAVSASASSASASASSSSSSEPAAASPPQPVAASGTASPWSSAAACRALFASGPLARSGPRRLATFNVEWFPDGKPGKKAPAEGGTDLEWLGCLLATLGADAIAVQEFKTLPRAREATATVLTALDRYSGGRWQAAFDDCPALAMEHVGILYDASRVSAGAPRTVAELNPHGQACVQNLRPGLELELTWPDQKRIRFVSVHFKSKSDARSLGLRDATFEILARTYDWSSTPVVVAGDLNTMGCSSCQPGLAPLDERRARGAALEKAGARLEPLERGCSYYYRREGQLLDGFVLGQGLGAARARTVGPCAEARCEHGSGVERGEAHRRVSDHCPLLLELPF